MVNELYCDVARIAAQKIGNDVLDSADLQLTVEEIEEVIKNYCNIVVVPRELRFTWANMVVDLYLHVVVSKSDFNTTGNTEINFNDIQKVELGDTEIWLGNTTRSDKSSKALNSHKPYLDNLIMNYTQQLQKFRKVVW